jgi:hypothetical protein
MDHLDLIAEIIRGFMLLTIIGLASFAFTVSLLTTLLP